MSDSQNNKKGRVKKDVLGNSLLVSDKPGSGIVYEEVEIDPVFILHYRNDQGGNFLGYFDTPAELLFFLEKGAYSSISISCKPKAIPALLQTLRKFRKLTQSQVGERLNYPATVIGNIEQGKRKVGLNYLDNLIQSLEGTLRVTVGLDRNHGA